MLQMADQDIINILENIETLEDAERIQRRPRVRADPYDDSDVSFKSRYRFSKDGVRHLVRVLTPYLERDQRGQPFSPAQVVCCGLNILGGGHFQRTEGVCSGATTSTAHTLLYR